MTTEITDVHLIFKTHLDVGFTDLARNVVAEYFTYLIPKALRIAEVLRQADRPERLVWTTGSWLIYEYLEQAGPAERARMEAAIAAGDIAWHGLPFTFHSELMDPSLFAFGLTLSQRLDRRFGRETIAAKMSDVPGHSRGIVPLLSEAGIRFLHIGVNSASTQPDVPPVFVWRDPSGSEVVVMYEQTYGSFATVPGSAAALAIDHTGDNGGPPSLDAILDAFNRLRRQCPTAYVHASTLDAFARAILPLKDRFPVVTSEIGDTWIHGVGSDPAKVAGFRELSRLRRHWLADGRVAPDDPAFDRFSRTLLLVPEHTWGLDTKKYLGDWRNYDAASFAAARDRPHYQLFASSWTEQRAYLDEAVEALDASPIADEARESLDRLRPRRPDPTGWTRIPADGTEFDTPHFRIRFDAGSGALVGFQDKSTGRDWASPDRPLAQIRYQTFSAADYERFMDQYVVPALRQEPWVLADQGKPGLETASPSSRSWLPTMTALYRRHDDAGERFLLDLTMPNEASAAYGAPRRFTLEYAFAAAEPHVSLILQWFDKPASRLPEALWCSFVPSVVPDGRWWLHKLGAWLPADEVVPNGNRRLHAVENGATYHASPDHFSIESPDAPLVAIGDPSLLDFTNALAPPEEGVHVNLFNNVWGTNFPQWYDDDASFRFVLSLENAR